MAAHGLHGAPYGHFGDGCVHVRIDFPLRAPGDRAAYREFITGAARLVAGLGGSMSGEHGDGRARGELLPLMYSPAALAAFAAVKSAFDPDGVLNPGVIVAPVPLDDGLRQVQARPLRHGLGFTYPDDGGDLTTAYAACMRSHGVTNFYFTKESNLPPDTPAINIAGWAVSAASVHQGSPTYKAASSACEDKMPGGPPAPMTEAQKEAALRQAACIRAHGFPTYPDPVFPAGGGVEQQPAPASTRARHSSRRQCRTAQSEQWAAAEPVGGPAAWPSQRPRPGAADPASLPAGKLSMHGLPRSAEG
jgi:hypothetical protein